MQVRRMLKHDVAAVEEIDKEDKSPWTASEIRTTYRARHSSSWVVENELQEVVGYCIVVSDWMITSIMRCRVKSGWQGVGYGDALLKTLIGATLESCSIEVAVDKECSAAQVLFSRNGFACVNDAETDYIFRRGDRFLYAPDLKYRLTSKHEELDGKTNG